MTKQILYNCFDVELTKIFISFCLYHFIRIGFMYVRYTQPPGDLFDWYEEYLQDEEEIDIKAGGGQVGSGQ